MRNDEKLYKCIRQPDLRIGYWGGLNGLDDMSIYRQPFFYQFGTES